MASKLDKSLQKESPPRFRVGSSGVVCKLARLYANLRPRMFRRMDFLTVKYLCSNKCML